MSYTDYPKSASNNAKRALKYKKESGNPKGCGTSVGWTRANQLANREPISAETVKRMASYNRHRQHKDVPYDEGCGGLMWDAWGGTSGVDWAIKKSKEIDDKKMESVEPNIKSMNSFITKRTGILKDVDLDKRIIEGYYSIFDFKDSDGDIMVKGCYAKSIKENGPGGENRIMHLYQHDPLTILGKPSMLLEDEKGLFFRTPITDTTLGTDVLKLYRDNVLKEHSVGMNFIQREYSNNDEAYICTEAKLWEGSTVTWGANMLALGGLAKGSQKDQVEQYKTLIKAFYNGDYTDETFLLIEMHIKNFEETFRKSLQTKEAEPFTSELNEADLDVIFKDFNNQLKIEKEFQKWT
jgi:HK97 family phage prohead protease